MRARLAAGEAVEAALAAELDAASTMAEQRADLTDGHRRGRFAREAERAEAIRCAIEAIEETLSDASAACPYCHGPVTKWQEDAAADHEHADDCALLAALVRLRMSEEE